MKKKEVLKQLDKERIDAFFIEENCLTVNLKRTDNDNDINDIIKKIEKIVNINEVELVHNLTYDYKYLNIFFGWKSKMTKKNFYNFLLRGDK